MTNDEKANEIARDMLPYNNAEYHACYNSAMKAMKWKDEQHKKEKQQWITKACEFWEHKFPYIGVDTIKEFVDTMKGGK